MYYERLMAHSCLQVDQNINIYLGLQTSVKIRTCRKIVFLHFRIAGTQNLLGLYIIVKTIQFNTLHEVMDWFWGEAETFLNFRLKQNFTREIQFAVVYTTYAFEPKKLVILRSFWRGIDCRALKDSIFEAKPSNKSIWKFKIYYQDRQLLGFALEIAIFWDRESLPSAKL